MATAMGMAVDGWRELATDGAMCCFFYIFVVFLIIAWSVTVLDRARFGSVQWRTTDRPIGQVLVGSMTQRHNVVKEG